jgi:hypothetical protein
MFDSTLLDEIHALQDRFVDSNRNERQVLDLAASLLEIIYEEETGGPPARVTRMATEDYFAMPNRFELLDGRIRPKYWGYWEDLYNRKKDDPA